MSRRLRLALFIGAFLGIASPALALYGAGGFGRASFSDGQRFESVVSAAELEISVGDVVTPIATDILAPGDTVVGAFQAINLGGVPLRYSVDLIGTIDPRLHDSIVLRGIVLPGGSECPTAAAWASGAQRRPLFEVTGAGWAATPVRLIGDATPGQQPGDRPLGSSGREQLCMALSMVVDVPNNAQAIAAEFELRVVGEQLNGPETSNE